MNDQPGCTIADAAMRTLEDLAFTFSRRVETGPAFEEKVIFATTGYHGAAQGRIALVARPEFGFNLVANLLDVDRSNGAGRQYATSAVAELLHVVCGIFVAESLGDNPNVDLSIAQAIVVPRPAAEAAVKTAREQVTLLTDDNWRLDLFVWN